MSHLKILVLLFTGFVGAAQAQNILEYACSDSVYQSTLRISDTGLVTINESCFDACPNHTFTKTYTLARQEFVELMGIMSATQHGQLEQRQINSKGLSCIGELSILRGETRVIIKKIEVPFYSNTGILTTNKSVASSQLESWVTKQVKQKIESDIPEN